MAKATPNVAELSPPKRLLLGPGPSQVHPRVLRAMATPLVGHLDPYFLKVMDRTQELLRWLFQTDNRLTIPVSGTGSAAMEASIANTVEPGDSVLICTNGYFGGRLADMAQRYGGQVQQIQKPWGEIFEPDEVAQALRARQAQVVAIVHAETSTGALQPLEAIAEVVHQQGGLLIVDAVTSLGGVPLNVDDWDIDVCYSGTQKCLSCPPGLGPVTFSQRAVEKMNNRSHAVANWYLDMTMVQKYWGAERSYHHTAPISSNYALYEGLRLVAEEGLQERWQRHQQNAERLWDGLQAMGLEPHVPLANRLPSLTTVRIPADVDGASVQARLRDEYNIEIAGGLGELKGKVWRIGLMGHSSQRENVALLLAALQDILT